MAAQNVPGQVKPVGTTNNHKINSIVDVLVTQGALTSDRGRQVKLVEVQTGKSQEKIIIEQKLVNEIAFARAKAVLYNVPFIDLGTTPVSPDALSVLPQEVAERFKVFPVSIDRVNKQLVLAMADPLNLTAIEFVEQKTGMIISPRAAEPSKVEEFITSRYSSTLSKEVTAALKEVAPDQDKIRSQAVPKTGFSVTPGVRTPVIRQEKISQIVTHVLEFAVRARASDVHIEPQEKSTRVRYRIDGILQEKLTIPRQLHDALISRIKILSKMKIDEKRVPQDGRFNFRTEGEEIDLRVSTLPTSWGEKVVMRLLKKTGGVPKLNELGLRGAALKSLEEAILKPHGIIIICGPTGSGKTTTLYSIIQRINTPKVNIMTLEDPIEYKIAGVNQVQVNPIAGLTFSSGMRSFLRQDPNVILVGEIRDKETAELAIQASLTGHLVFSTLHTNNAAGAIPRLLDLGAEPFLLASSVTAIAAQRVLRKIDPKGKESYDPGPNITQDIADVLGSMLPKDKPIKLYRGTPSAENNNSGFLGRVGIFEVLPVTDKISKLILSRSPATLIEKQAVVDGMITLKQDGYMKVIEGATTIEEVLRVAEE